MRRTVLALVLALTVLVAILFAPAPASACWKCTQKLRCYSQDCWTEWVCITNLVFNQLGFSDCWETIGGCSTEGEICRWTAFPKNEAVQPFLRGETAEHHHGPLLCGAS